MKGKIAMETLINVANFISRKDIVIIWIIIASLFYLIMAWRSTDKERFNLTNGISFVVSTVAILGGINILLTNIYEANTQETKSDLKCLYDSIGGLTILYVSGKSIIDKLGFLRVFENKKNNSYKVV